MRAPALSSRSAARHRNGPLPAITLLPWGTAPVDCSCICVRPSATTPASREPSKSKERSTAPTARITRIALTRNETPPALKASSKWGASPVTVAPRTYCAPLATTSPAIFSPIQ